MIPQTNTINTDITKEIISHTTDKVNQQCVCVAMQPVLVLGDAFEIIREQKNPTKAVLSIVSDKNNTVLMAKPNLMAMEGVKVSRYSSFIASERINNWMEDGTIESYTEACYTTHNATTVQVKSQKGTSDLLLGLIQNFVDSTLTEICTELTKPSTDHYLELTKDHVKPKRTSVIGQKLSDIVYATEYRYNTDKQSHFEDKQQWQIVKLKLYVDTIQNKFEAAYETLNVWQPLLPGGRRNYIISKLFMRYEHETLRLAIETKLLDKNLNLQQYICKELQVGTYKEDKGVEQGRVMTRGDIDVEMDGEEIYMVYKSSSHLYHLPLSTSDVLTLPVNTTDYPCTTLPLLPPAPSTSPLPFSVSNLVCSYNFKLNSHPDFIQSFNDLALQFLSGYEPSNDLEKRCKQVMVGTGKAFPMSYLRLSECPRLYAEGKDNLFYCPSSMRQSLSKGLNLHEWDIVSCHTNILLGLFGSSFPLLKGMVERNSIWKDYEEYFISKSCPFNKPIIKAFHYATILGGGTKAYRQALSKSIKDGIIITPQDADQLIKVYKSHPVVREMKAFINKWGYFNTSVTYPTGESHTIILPTTIIDKETGKKVRDFTNSNTLQVFSGLLRAWEMVLISYVGLSHPEAFSILLHQHDGITVVEHLPNAFELAQEALTEISVICFPNLSKPIKLEIKL